MIDEKTLQQRMQRIGDLVSRVDSEEDVRALRAQAKELLQSVMDLHGEALDRVRQRLVAGGEAGEVLLASLAGDPVVSSVLLLYGLHPLDFNTRVRQALEKIRPTLRSYGVDGDLIGTTGGGVRIRLRGVDSSFTAKTVRAAVEDELYAAAPDATSLVLQGLEKFAAPDFVPLEMVGLATAGKSGD
jgi:hypothetical protein